MLWSEIEESKRLQTTDIENKTKPTNNNPQKDIFQQCDI